MESTTKPHFKMIVYTHVHIDMLIIVDLSIYIYRYTSISIVNIQGDAHQLLSYKLASKPD